MIGWIALAVSVAAFSAVIAAYRSLSHRINSNSLRMNGRIDSLSANSILAKESLHKAHCKINSINQRLDKNDRLSKFKHAKNNGCKNQETQNLEPVTKNEHTQIHNLKK